MADDPEETELNRRAFFALEGGSLDCTGDLIRLLRSSDPIHPIVRERIAEALDGGTIGGARLVLTDHKGMRDVYRGIASRHRKLGIGSLIQSLVDSGISSGQAIEIVARDESASQKLCEGALTFYRKASALADKMHGRPEFRKFDRDTLLSMAGAQIGRDAQPSQKLVRRRPSRSST